MGTVDLANEFLSILGELRNFNVLTVDEHEKIDKTEAAVENLSIDILMRGIQDQRTTNIGKNKKDICT